MTEVTPEIVREHGLSDDEYANIKQLLGRDPNLVELGVFSVMWSEHCSYKSTRAHLRRLPTTGPQVIQGLGENAGVVDIGDGDVIVFKMESHNHPSYIEPYQGAATGIGCGNHCSIKTGYRVPSRNHFVLGKIFKHAINALLFIHEFSQYSRASRGRTGFSFKISFEECCLYLIEERFF